MKAPAVIVSIAAGLGLVIGRGQAGDFAPPSLAAESFSATVVSGSAPFRSNGSYMIFTSPLGSNFVVLGSAENGLSWGSYSYTPTGTNTGLATLADSTSALNAAISFVFASPSTGQLTLTNGGGFQTANFVAMDYAEVATPQFYQPYYSNGVFNAYVSGQAGGVYAVQTSSDLMNWTAAGSLALTTATGVFGNTNVDGDAARYYKATAALVDFAPGAISNESLNFTIIQGAAPLATNGFFQLTTDSFGPGYDEWVGPILTNLPGGTYSYAKFAPGAAFLSWVDAESVTHFAKLVFTSATSGYFYATNDSGTGFQAGQLTTAVGPTVFLGTYHFTPDTARANSLDFAADGNPASLSVTNALGDVWTLRLPADALLEPQPITMTPAASVDSGNAVIPALAAVLLQPDGIQFCDAITLSVTTPSALGTNATLMNAALDGSGLSFALTTNEGNTYATTLFHFSSAALVNIPASLLQNSVEVESLIASLQQAEADAGFLVLHHQPPPPPPNDEWTCDPQSHTRAAQDAGTYLNSAFGNERSAIQQLISTGQALAQLGLPSYQADASMAVVQLFQEDIFPGLNSLVNTYGSDRTTLPVVVLVTLQLTKQAVQFEIPVPPNLQLGMQNDLQNVGSQYVNDVSSKNLYSSIPTALYVAQQLQLLAGDSSGIISKLGSALNFQLAMDAKGSVNENDVCTSMQNVEAEGTLQITFTGTMSFTGMIPLQGTGTCGYLSGNFNGSCGGESFSATLGAGQSFPTTVTVTFNDCPSLGLPTATLMFSEIGSPAETWDYSPGGDMTRSFLNADFSTSFPSTHNMNGYTFTVPMQDGNIEAIDYTTNGAGELGAEYQATLKLTLQHQ